MVEIRTLSHPRDEIMSTMERIYRYRMTTTSGGNISIRDSESNIWITPARVDKGNLKREDIVCVVGAGTSGSANHEIEGRHLPSSEFPFHHAIYEVRSDVRAIVHAHPVGLVAFSMCGQVPDTRLFHQAYHMSGKVGFAPYALPGSKQLGANIAASFERGCDCVILENHGVVVGGESLSHAFQRFEAFEFAAKTLLKARRLGDIHYLNESDLLRANQRRLDMETGDEKSIASNAEREERRTLVEFIKRGCRQRLLISTEGSFSSRLDATRFLITPSQKDRELLTVDDLVLVTGNSHEPQKKPSRAARLHQAIYARNPEVRSIVFAHPVNATAFSITSARLDARTIPESYVFLRDVARLPYGIQYEADGRTIGEALSMRVPAAIVENDGVAVVGRNVLDAFDRLEVLESTAEAIINASILGPLTPMSDAALSELRAAFRMD